MSLSGQGRFAEAEPFYREVIAETEQRQGPDSPALVGPLYKAAAHFRIVGNLDEALGLSDRAVVIAQAEMPTDSWLAALPVAEYAHTLRALGRIEEARQQYETAHAILLATFGEENFRVLELAAILAGE